MTQTVEIAVGAFAEIDNPGCREFRIGEGEWPLRGFVVRRGEEIYAYENVCMHVGHPLNWQRDRFLSKDKSAIICASHGAMYEIESGLCFAGPCPGKKLRSLAACVRDGEVYVTGPTSA